MQSSTEVSLPLASCRQRGQGGRRRQDRHDTTGSAGRKPGCRKGWTARPSSGCTAGGLASHTWTLKHTYTYCICLYTHTQNPMENVGHHSKAMESQGKCWPRFWSVRTHTCTHTHTHTVTYVIHAHKTPWKLLTMILKQQNNKENADPDSEAHMCARTHTHTHTHTKPHGKCWPWSWSNTITREMLTQTLKQQTQSHEKQNT